MSDIVIVILGSPNDTNGRLFSIALERCRLAARLATDNPGALLLPTGGFGDHFNTSPEPHAEYLRRYLVELGIASTRFLSPALSRNTIEDASLSKPIVVARGARTILVVTSDYHLARARYWFDREYADTGIGLAFVTSDTNERACELDLAALKEHERRSLARLLGEMR